jgi:hypothetical protein
MCRQGRICSRHRTTTPEAGRSQSFYDSVEPPQRRPHLAKLHSVTSPELNRQTHGPSHRAHIDFRICVRDNSGRFVLCAKSRAELLYPDGSTLVDNAADKPVYCLFPACQVQRGADH